MSTVQKLPSIPPWGKWSPDVLRAEKRRNPRMFARGFHLRPFEDSERMFPSFRSCFSNGVKAADIKGRGWPTFVGVDLAGQNRPGNCIFVFAVDPQNQRRYPTEIHYGTWKSPQTAQRLSEIYARTPNLRFIMVENNAYQQSLVDWIQHSVRDYSFWVKVEPFTTGKNKADPHYGLPSLEVEYSNKAWVIPHDEFEGHMVDCQCGWCHWVREVEDYPNGATTDGVMAQWFAREALDRWGGVGVAAASVGDLNTR